MSRGIGERIAAWLADKVMDRMMTRFWTEPYTENIMAMLPIVDKVSVLYMLEAGMRAEKGKPLSRPLGSPNVQSPWNRVFINPTHLVRMPTDDKTKIDTHTVIGPRADRPLELDIPIMIAGMSYGGALSKPAKLALARGASLAGTATNTGEAPLVPEERAAAAKLIGQFNRGGWLNSTADLEQLDAIEIQLGQGAQGSAPQRTPEWMTGPEYRQLYRLDDGEDPVIHSRLPGVNSVRDFVRQARKLKSTHKVPVGLKLAAAHYLERELEIGLQAGLDFFVLDGAEGGTHGGATILQDDVGLPTIYAIARAARYLHKQGVKDQVSLIAAGGLVTPGHFLKALALGADAVYIGTIALIGLMHTQINKALPTEPPPQLLLYTGRYFEDLDIDRGAQDLARFLKSCVKEMESVAYSTGHGRLDEFSVTDLCCVDRDLAEALGIDWVGRPPVLDREGTGERLRVQANVSDAQPAGRSGNGKLMHTSHSEREGAPEGHQVEEP